MQKNHALDSFFREHERRAFRIAEMATGNVDDALDILQDSMFKLADKYADREPAEWRPLFLTILHHRIRDHYRRSSVRNRFRVWFQWGHNSDDAEDNPYENFADEQQSSPVQEVETAQSYALLSREVRRLPFRQQQAFMLRALEGLDVANTATLMGCSEGSVKTHYSRAVKHLRLQIGELIL